MTAATLNRADPKPHLEISPNRSRKERRTSKHRNLGVTWLAFTLTAGTLGLAWHELLFKSEYESFNFITAEKVIAPLALLSMLTLGFISSYLYTRLFDPAKGLSGGIRIGLVVLVLPRLAVTLAQASEQDVNGHVADLIIYETALYILMGLTWGALAALAHRSTSHSNQADAATKGTIR